MMFFTPYGNHYLPYLATPCLLLSGVAGTALKSTLTKLVPADEVSHTNIFVSLTE